MHRDKSPPLTLVLYLNCSSFWTGKRSLHPKGISKRALVGKKTVSVGVDILVTQNGRPSPPQEHFLAALTARERSLYPRLIYGPPMYKRHCRVVKPITKLKLSALIWYSSEGQNHTDVPLCGNLPKLKCNKSIRKDVANLCCKLRLEITS